MKFLPWKKKWGGYTQSRGDGHHIGHHDIRDQNQHHSKRHNPLKTDKYSMRNSSGLRLRQWCHLNNRRTVILECGFHLVPLTMHEFNDESNYRFTTTAIICSILESDNYSPKEMEQQNEHGANGRFTDVHHWMWDLWVFGLSPYINTQITYCLFVWFVSQNIKTAIWPWYQCQGCEFTHLGNPKWLRQRRRYTYCDAAESCCLLPKPLQKPLP